jgi:hypothetical protein
MRERNQLYVYFILFLPIIDMLDLQQYINSPTIDYTQIDATTSSFEIKYLPRGFGHTMGNALRRIIVGYNYGSAVTALKIK